MNKSVGYLMPLLFTFIVCNAIVQSLVQVALSKSPSFARVESSGDIHPVTQIAETLPPSHDFASRKENAFRLWEERRFSEAAKEFNALWNERAAKKTKSYDKEFVSVARCLANVYRDMGAFKSALQCHQAILKYEQGCVKPNDARLAVNYNNIGLCHYLQGEVEGTESSRNEAFRSALTAYRHAEVIWMNENFDSPDVSLNLRNQFITNIELRDEEQATAIRRRIQILAAKPNHAGALESTTYIGALVPAKVTN